MSLRSWLTRLTGGHTTPSSPLDVLARLDFDPCQSMFCGADATHRCAFHCPHGHDHTLLLCDRHQQVLTDYHAAAGEFAALITEPIGRTP